MGLCLVIVSNAKFVYLFISDVSDKQCVILITCSDSISVCGAWLCSQLLCQATLGRCWRRCNSSFTVSRLQLPALITTAAQSADDERRGVSSLGRHCSQFCDTVNSRVQCRSWCNCKFISLSVACMS